MAYNTNYGNRFQNTTPIVLNLIIINAIVFLIQSLFDGPESRITAWLALWPLGSGLFEPYQMVTHLFTHGGFAHILFNMFALWSFGTTLERIWGPKKFLFFYIICGLAAGVAQLFLSNAPAVGASGAIMGVLAGFVYLYPNAELLIFPIPFPVKAKYAIGGFALLDIFGAFNPTGDNIAHFAHLGGLIMGFILVIYWSKTDKRTPY
jgi:membrane associated rhomboid family serine protease